MNNPWTIIAVTVALIALSAFFVAVEFALLGARRHRLEDAAPSSRSARAALRSSNELTALLAGSQLGITLCTLALGATTKPAVHYWLTPQFERIGIVTWFADVLGFVLALMIVTFLHLVVGEMAPKSWAIAHPERSATLLSIPMRAFMWFTRPILRILDSMANWCLTKVGVQPANRSDGGHDPDTLRHLVEHSVAVGALDKEDSAGLEGALALQKADVRHLLGGSDPVVVGPDATVGDVREVSLRVGHRRILVENGGEIIGVVHVRDTLERPPGERADSVMRPAFVLEAGTPVYSALASMRQTRNQLAVVMEGREILGVVTVSDIVNKVAPVG